MKISTLRTLLLVCDVMLVLGIGLVIWNVVEEKKARSSENQVYMADVRRKLAAIKPEGVTGRRKIDYGGAITEGVLWPKKVVEAVAASNVQAPPPKAPVETQLKVLLIQYSTAGMPSMAYFVKRDGTTASIADPLMPYLEGHVVEWASGALVKKIEPGRVVFTSDGREVALEPEPYKLTGAASGPSAPKVLGPVDANTSTWIEWQVAKPGTITITEMGARAFGDKGEATLDGVRFASERLEDGKDAVKLDAIPVDNVLRRGGAEEGDVLESINGIRMTTKADVIAYAKNNPETTRFEVRLRRKGVTMTRTVVVPRR
ncbi:MAG: hypothetical protein EXS14_04175 [Planctomycetes bacterium]|nr:hypothetical protein [Planctomycetota bacterium]